MKRHWTDRDGRAWSVTLVEGSSRGERPDPPEEDAAALEFRSNGTTRTVPTDRVGDLNALEDGELQDLLDQATEDTDPDEDLRDAEGQEGREGKEGERPSRRGPGPASPDAAGRESAPHADPAKHGPATTD